MTRTTVVAALAVFFFTLLTTLMALDVAAQRGATLPDEPRPPATGVTVEPSESVAQGAGPNDEHFAYLPTVQGGSGVLIIEDDGMQYYRVYVAENTGAWGIGILSKESYEDMLSSTPIVFTETYRLSAYNSSPWMSTRQWTRVRAFLSFDLSKLPPGRIVGARLGMHTGMGAITTHSDFDIYFHEGTWTGVPKSEDYDSFVSEPLSTFYAGDVPGIHSYFTVTLDSLVGRERPDTMPFVIRIPDEELPLETRLHAQIAARGYVAYLDGTVEYPPMTYLDIAIEPLDH